MAFKKTQPPTPVPDSPLKLFHDNRRGTVQGLWEHQDKLLRSYADQAVNASDVALQLPTGSGKTLVGLLIGEWCRRKNRERVVYLCPTRQLVNQVAAQADRNYGLNVLSFTGSARDYAPVSASAYRDADSIAITTYNSLFNTDPFFHDADVVIVDDAHAAENYMASLWSVRIRKDAHPVIHDAFCGILRPFLNATDHQRISGVCSDASDRDWIDKIPTPRLAELADGIAAMIDANIGEPENRDIRFPWSMIKDHLIACQIYLSSRDILIRPLIPPTWTHAPFANPRQRIYMSATLGLGGDLERITGRSNIHRLPIPDGWDGRGMGRRFFIFPGKSLDEDESTSLRRELMRKAGRSLMLVPSIEMQNAAIQDVSENLKFATYAADALEGSKAGFLAQKQAVAVVAGRYDGIDFPGDECRLLFVDGLPKATNSQERFLMAKMGATILFNERIQTRVIQAIGRCTRSSKDFSAVVVTGEELTRYLTDIKRIPFLSPELQAELQFGVTESKETAYSDILENFDIFMENGAAWAMANDRIVADRDSRTQKAFPDTDALRAAVPHEIGFQKGMWRQDFESALESAERVLGQLMSPDLRGYRALWHYLAGSAAWLGGRSMDGLQTKARTHFRQAKDAAMGIPWLVNLSQYQAEIPAPERGNAALLSQVERLEHVLFRLGTINDRKFAKNEAQILRGLRSNDTFEEAQRLLGDLLGFDAGKVETDGSPDPWWISGDLCLVFEDHAGALEGSALSVNKARQVASHPNWMKDHVPECADATILPVLLTPISKVQPGATSQLKGVSLWPLDEFRAWAQKAVSVVRNLRTTFSEPGNLDWRMKAVEELEKEGLDMAGLVRMLQAKPALSILQTVGSSK